MYHDDFEFENMDLCDRCGTAKGVVNNLCTSCEQALEEAAGEPTDYDYRMQERRQMGLGNF